MQHCADDSELARRAAAGDRGTFRVLVESHSAQVYRIALGLVRDHHDAEEVVQETFLRAFRGMQRFRGDASFSSWLYRIAVNAGHDLGRKRRRRQPEQSMETPVAWPEPVTDHPDDDPERWASSRLLRAEIDRAVLGLTERERIIFVLRHDAGLKIGEIADVLGKAEGTVKNLLFRAVRKLRRSLNDHLENLEVPS
ncbi:MAG: sigma-70 family RNA polymerase sigma factor [bacterium]|nr:sigma-70 family RNA polymerase sigma factor [bacterium]